MMMNCIIICFIVCVLLSGFIECDTLNGYFFSWKKFFKGCAIGFIPAILVSGCITWMFNI